MNVLVENIEVVIKEIDLLIELLISGAKAEKEELLSYAAAGIITIFPQIVESYMKPELESVKGDMQYWVDQMDRIISALSGKDRFLMIDVLKYETKENLILYKNMISQVGLS